MSSDIPDKIKMELLTHHEGPFESPEFGCAPYRNEVPEPLYVTIKYNDNSALRLTHEQMAAAADIDVTEVDVVCGTVMKRAFPWWHLWKWPRFWRLRKEHEAKRARVAEVARQHIVDELNRQQPGDPLVHVRFL